MAVAKVQDYILVETVDKVMEPERIFYFNVRKLLITALLASHSLSVWASEITLSWDSVDFADKYKLVRADGAIEDNGAFATEFSGIADTNYQDDTVVEGNIYTYKVIGCIDNPATGATLCDDVAVYSDPLEIYIGSDVPTISIETLVNDTASYIVRWDFIPSMSFYQIEENIDDAGWVVIDDALEDNFYEFYSKAPATYQYRVRACNETSCGHYSTVQSKVVDWFFGQCVAP